MDAEHCFQVYILADKVSLYGMCVSVLGSTLELFVANLDPWILTVFLKSGILTMNVPVVYMGRDLWIWMGE
jgi:hypothetical protein